MITKININNSLIVKIDLITLTHIRIRIWKLELLSNIAKLSLKNRSTYSYVWYNTLLFILIYIYIYIYHIHIYMYFWFLCDTILYTCIKPSKCRTPAQFLFTKMRFTEAAATLQSLR